MTYSECLIKKLLERFHQSNDLSEYGFEEILRCGNYSYEELLKDGDQWEFLYAYERCHEIYLNLLKAFGFRKTRIYTKLKWSLRGLRIFMKYKYGDFPSRNFNFFLPPRGHSCFDEQVFNRRRSRKIHSFDEFFGRKDELFMEAQKILRLEFKKRVYAMDNAYRFYMGKCSTKKFSKLGCDKEFIDNMMNGRGSVMRFFVHLYHYWTRKDSGEEESSEVLWSGMMMVKVRVDDLVSNYNNYFKYLMDVWDRYYSFEQPVYRDSNKELSVAFSRFRKGLSFTK